MNTIKRGDVFFCLGSPDAVGSEERKTRPVVIVQNNAGNASSPTVIVANMTTNTTRRLYPTALGELIDALCDMTKVVNFEEIPVIEPVKGETDNDEK